MEVTSLGNRSILLEREKILALSFLCIKMDLSKPEVFGPGTWFTLHTLATAVSNEKEANAFEQTLKTIVSNLKCETCRNHATQYYANHPFAEFVSMKNAEHKWIGPAKYVWLFHNEVNDRLGKPNIDWETAYAAYLPSSGLCKSDCGAQLIVDDEPQIPAPPLPGFWNYKGIFPPKTPVVPVEIPKTRYKVYCKKSDKKCKKH